MTCTQSAIADLVAIGLRVGELDARDGAALERAERCGDSNAVVWVRDDEVGGVVDAHDVKTS